MDGLKSDLLKIEQKEEVVKTFAEHVSSGKVNFFQSVGIDFVIGKREGAYLWDVSGEEKLIDCHCNGGVFNLGHRNAEIIESLISGLKEFDIGNHHLISERRASLAKKIAELTPEEINYTVFGVGGGEAVDVAIKIARGYTGKPEVISAKGSYHGHTGLALSAGDRKYYAPFGPRSPGFSQVQFGDVEALRSAVSDETAAVILETIPATYGMPIPAEDYFPQVMELCENHGILLIIDEVQTGLGRTGKLWGFEHFDIVPDILVTGKGLSGGIYPISATCFKEKYEVVFHADPFIHVSTFGGAEIGCTIALKVLELSSSPEFLAHVKELAYVFKDGFNGLKEKHPEVLVGLRQLGMMMGIELFEEQCGLLFSKVAYDN